MDQPVEPPFEKYKRQPVLSELRPLSEKELGNEGDSPNPVMLAGRLREKGISVGENDVENGSPKRGDYIARNPDDHDDKWLVSAEYFDANFEPEPVPEGLPVTLETSKRRLLEAGLTVRITPYGSVNVYEAGEEAGHEPYYSVFLGNFSYYKNPILQERAAVEVAALVALERMRKENTQNTAQTS